MKALNRSALHPYLLSPDAELPSVVGLENPKANVGFIQDPQADLGSLQVPCVKSATQLVTAPANSAPSISTMADNIAPYLLPRGSGGKSRSFGSHKMSDVVSFVSGYLYSHPTPISQSAGRFAQVISALSLIHI